MVRRQDTQAVSGQERSLLRFVYCALLAAAMGPRSGVAQQFLVEGACVHERYTSPPSRTSPDRPVILNQTQYSRFRVLVNGCKWFIRFEESGAVTDYHEAGSEGMEIYRLVSIKGSVERDRKAGKQVGMNTAIGAVDPGPVFMANSKPPLSIIWLAYCSGCFFRTNTSNSMRPIFVDPELAAPLSFPTFQVRAFYGLLPGLNFPKWVTFMTPDFVSLADEVKIPGWLRRPLNPPFDKGYSNLHFEVTTLTNFSGFSFPKEFSLHEFGLKLRPTGPQVLTRNLYFFEATNFSATVPPVSYIPTLAGRALIGDNRLRDANTPEILYHAHNHWFTLEEAKQARASQAHKKRPIRERVVPDHAKFLFVTFLTCVGFTLAIVTYRQTDIKHIKM
jgi:hypothetical protein